MIRSIFPIFGSERTHKPRLECFCFFFSCFFFVDLNSRQQSAICRHGTTFHFFLFSDVELKLSTVSAATI